MINEQGRQEPAKHELTEESSRERNQRYRALFDRTNDAVFIISLAGIFLEVNDRAAEMLGYEIHELVGTSATDYVASDEFEESESALHALKSGHVFPIYERTMRRKDGVEFPVELNVAMVYDEKGNPLHIQSIVRDITGRKQVRNELEALVKDRTDELEQANAQLMLEIAKHQQTENALRNSERIYRELVEKLQEGVITENTEGIITFVNPRAAELLGYSKEELIGQPISITTPLEETKKMKEETAKRSYGISSTYETTILMKDGQSIPARISATPLFTPDGVFREILSIFTDISEIKQTELALRESEAKYRTILENIQDGYYEVDKTGNFTFVNSSLSKGLGYSADELIGMNNRQYMSDETAKAVFQAFNLVYRTGKPSKAFNWELIRKDGTKRNVESSISLITDSTGEPVGFQGIVRDVTERKQMELALQESQEQYRELVEKMQEGVLTEDTDGIITFVNPKTAEMLGYSMEELIGQPAINIVPETHREKIIEETAKRPHGISSTYEAALQAKDGHSIPVIIHATPLFSSDQNFRGDLAVFTDITERKRAEEELKRQKAELSEFAHAMNHDMKNQLLSIEGYAEILEYEYDKNYSKKIRNLAQNMNELLRRSVALADAGLVIGETEELDLAALVRDVAKAIIPENVVFKLDNLPTVQGDREKLSQVFRNLFENAIAHAAPSRVEVRHRAAVNGTAILIINDGRPIAPEHQKKIFQRGFTTKKKGGLGLAIVKKLVAAHGWDITLEPGSETAFRMLIPGNG
jgi:PAS domain S-box-containing protein